MSNVRYISADERGFSYETLANAKLKRDRRDDGLTGGPTPIVPPSGISTGVFYVGGYTTGATGDLWLKAGKVNLIGGVYSFEILWEVLLAVPEGDLARERYIIPCVLNDTLYAVSYTDLETRLWRINPSNGAVLSNEQIKTYANMNTGTLFDAGIDKLGRIWFNDEDRVVRLNDPANNVSDKDEFAVGAGSGPVQKFSVASNGWFILGNSFNWRIVTNADETHQTGTWSTVTSGYGQVTDVHLTEDSFYGGTAGNNTRHFKADIDGSNSWFAQLFGSGEQNFQLPVVIDDELVIARNPSSEGYLARFNISTGALLDQWLLGSNLSVGYDASGACQFNFQVAGKKPVITVHRRTSGVILSDIADNARVNNDTISSGILAFANAGAYAVACHPRRKWRVQY